MKLLLLIRSLEAGGAERQLVTLARGLHARGHGVGVAAFYARGPFLRELTDSGVPVHDLRKAGRWDVAGFLLRLLRLIRGEAPQVVYSFMAGANVLTALLRPFAPGVRWVWGVRSSYLELRRYDWLARGTYRLEARWASRADRIVANSSAGQAVLLEAGYPPARVSVVRNGIDVEAWRPQPEAGCALRKHWGLAPAQPLLGIVGRLDAIKDHPTFLRAAARLAEQRPDAHFVVVGGGPPAYRDELARLAASLGLAARVRWAGPRDDMAAVYSALHLNTSASAGEGLSNAIVEAMACSVPCVVTDVGDSAEVVGDTGAVVPPRDPAAMAAAWERLLALAPERLAALGAGARQRVAALFGVERMVSETEALLQALLPEGRR